MINCSWILPTCVDERYNEVPYTRAKDIGFLSAKTIWSKESLTRELRIYNSCKPQAIQQLLFLGLHWPVHHAAHQGAWAPSREEMAQLYAKLNQCKIKAVALSLKDPFAGQFIDHSRSVPVVPERSFCHKLVHSLSSLELVCSFFATR